MTTYIRPYCNVCQMCKDAGEFGKTQRGTYKYICLKCENHKNHEESKKLYNDTKEKIKESSIHHKILEDTKHDYIIFNCPYSDCSIMSIVYNNDRGCNIFRCGYNRATGQQIPQHENKTNCDILRHSGDIIGCARPYRLINNTPEKCEYI